MTQDMLAAEPRPTVPEEPQKASRFSVPKFYSVPELKTRCSDLLKKFLSKYRRHLPDMQDTTTERTLIENIEDLGALTAEDVMVPRVDILAIGVNAKRDDFLELIKITPHSRIPVYEETLDDAIGFIHIKDVLRTMAHGYEINLRDLMRPIMIVSPSMPALDLLVDMRNSKKHLALVVDEYGGIDGLVTMGDLIETIVGELSDEHNTLEQSPLLIERPDGSIIVDARYGIGLFEKQYGEIFAENERSEADTLGGLAMFIAGRLPKRGELLVHQASNVHIEVIDADPRHLKRLRLRNLPKKQVSEGTLPSAS